MGLAVAKSKGDKIEVLFNQRLARLRLGQDCQKERT